MKERLPVIWSNIASTSFRRIYVFIKEKSPTNAEKVSREIIKAVDSLPRNPEKFPPDKLKKNNKGNYRAFEKYSYRIAYKYTKENIVILRIRHVKQEPKEY